MISPRWIRKGILIFVFCYAWQFSIVITEAGATNSYYDILGVSKTANDKEIQRAYRKLALKHHPDKGGDEEKFKELSKAYDCLSDTGKRQIYDNYGDAGLENPGMNGGFPGGFGGGDGHPFSSFFTTSATGAGAGNGGGFRTESFSFGRSPGAGASGMANGNVDISELLKEMFMGGNAGSADSTFFSQGMGGPQFGRGAPSAQQSSASPQSYTKSIKCTLEDLATGRTKKLKVSHQGQEKVFEVALKPGWKEGTAITYPPTRDFPFRMTFKIKEVPHKHLIRDGNDLRYTCWIDDGQTQGGIKINIPLPTGELWSRQISKNDKEQVLHHGQQMHVPSKGMPIKGGPERGDLHIVFLVRRTSSASN